MKDVKSPCVKICQLDKDDVCLGCGRTLGQIKKWMSYNDDERMRIMLECFQRTAYINDKYKDGN